MQAASSPVSSAATATATAAAATARRQSGKHKVMFWSTSMVHGVEKNTRKISATVCLWTLLITYTGDIPIDVCHATNAKGGRARGEGRKITQGTPLWLVSCTEGVDLQHDTVSFGRKEDVATFAELFDSSGRQVSVRPSDLNGKFEQAKENGVWMDVRVDEISDIGEQPQTGRYSIPRISAVHIANTKLWIVVRALQ
jgi:hypothetical protein